MSYGMCTLLQNMTVLQRSTALGRFVALRSFSLVQVAHYPDCSNFVTFSFSVDDS